MLGTARTGWRTFARWDRGEPARRVMVMLKMEERDELASDIAGQVAAARPLAAADHRLGAGPGDPTRTAAAPRVVRGRARRSTSCSSNRSASGHPQVEFRAIVEAINLLMQRSRAALARERQLADELAHELRTPLASIALHASALQRPLDEDDRRQSLDRLAQDAMRSGHVLSQVLALARASQTEMTEAAQPVDMRPLARRVVSDSRRRPMSGGRVLAYGGPTEGARCSGHPVLLELALRNLVENAVSHTPAGTSIDVQLDESGALAPGPRRWSSPCQRG